MPFRITIPLVLVVAFAAVGGVGTFLLPQWMPAGGSGGNPDVIKVVSSMPRSGSARGQTDTIRNGLLLAFHEVGNEIELTDPATGEKKKYKLTYEDLDDATASAGDWTIEQEIANANYARRDPDVMAYVGTYNSGAAKVSMPITNRAGLLMISPANTAESLTKPGTGERHEPDCYRPTRNPDGTPRLNYVRVVPTDDLQSLLGVYFIARPTLKDANGKVTQVGLAAKKIYILDDNQLYGKGLADAVKKHCQDPKLGFNIEVLGQTSIDAKAQTYETLMTKIKGLNPDAIYFGGTTQSNAGQLLKDMRNAGLKGVPVVGPDGCFETAIIKAAGADTFEDVPFYATFGGLPTEGLIAAGGKSKQYVDSYAAKYGAAPTEAYAVYGYECGVVLLEALKKAGKKDREAIRQAVFAVAQYHGATGTFSFDPATGDTSNKFMSVNQAKKVTDTDPKTGEKKTETRFTFTDRLEMPPPR